MACLAAFAAAPAADAVWVDYYSGLWRNEDASGPGWLTGYLTWNGTHGGISWDPAAPTQPHGGIAAMSPIPPGSPAYDVFNSTALPFDLYVNPAHLIQLDLVRKGSGNFPEVRLYANGDFVAGATYIGNRVLFNPQPPSPPAGYSVVNHRMPTEELFIPKGSNLILEIHYPRGSRQPWKTSDEFRSVIRIPYFTAEEAFYRMPEVVPQLRPAGEPTDSPQKSVERLLDPLPAASLLPIPLLALSPSRRRGVALLGLLLLGSGLAGCLGGAPRGGDSGLTTTQEPPKVTYYEPGGSGLADDENGSILGQVIDAYRRPIEGVHVLALGTPHSTLTDRTGLFSFRGLSPGPITLRLDKPDYLSREFEVEVVANRIARVEVELEFAEQEDSDARAHIHDYWGEETSKVVFDGPLAERCETHLCQTIHQFYLLPLDTTGGDLIRPGTSHVNVTLTFDTARTGYRKIGLIVQGNEDPNPGNVTAYLPRESGKTFEVKSTWETTDVGHQLFSTWTFRTYIMPEDKVGTTLDRPPVGFLLPDSTPVIKNVKIEIRRGALPVERAHPDRWAGADNLTLMKAGTWRSDGCYRSSETKCQEPQIPVEVCKTTGTSGPICGDGSGRRTGGCFDQPRTALSGGHEDTAWANLGPPLLPVPTYSKDLVLTVRQSSVNGVGASSVPVYDWVLWYKNGDTPLQPYFKGNPSYKQAPSPTVSADGLTRTWTLPTVVKDWDGIYNSKSAWSFTLVPSDQTIACIDAMFDSGPGTITWTLVANREPA